MDKKNKIVNKKYTLEYIKENNLIILDAISGSMAYGTNVKGSDVDRRGLFIADMDDYLCGNYPEQVNDKLNDIVYFEIGKFFELLIKNNPNILELLNIPSDCVEFRHELMDLIDLNDYISKLCRGSIGGYATTQIKKARGLGKKIVNPMDEERKTPVDFCYVISDNETYPLSRLMEGKKMDDMFFGATKMPNAKDLYSLYYDWDAHNGFSERIPKEDRVQYLSDKKKYGEPLGLGYGGLTIENSSTIRLSSIPKGKTLICNISYNQDAFTQHCNAHKDYFDWVKNRNQDRYKISEKKGYNAKNLMHCYRLAEMGIEIAEGKGVIVRRPNREFLLTIRNGEMEYDDILELAEGLLVKSDEAFAKSELREKPDINKARETEVLIRKKFYEIKF